jgi:hypothetical protein
VLAALATSAGLAPGRPTSARELLIGFSLAALARDPVALELA